MQVVCSTDQLVDALNQIAVYQVTVIYQRQLGEAIHVQNSMEKHENTCENKEFDI